MLEHGFGAIDVDGTADADMAKVPLTRAVALLGPRVGRLAFRCLDARERPRQSTSPISME